MRLDTRESNILEALIWENIRELKPYLKTHLARGIHSGHDLDFYKDLKLDFRFGKNPSSNNYGMDIEIRMIDGGNCNYGVQPFRSNLDDRGLKALFKMVWKNVSKKDIKIITLQSAKKYHFGDWNFPMKRVNVAEGSNDPEWIVDKENLDAFNYFYSQVEREKVIIRQSFKYLSQKVLAK